jgi:hypothetical protein
MTRFSRALSTTSLVTNARALISRIRSTCVRSRFTNRKLPPVIRMIEAAAIESIASPGSLTPDGITYSVYWLGRNCLAMAVANQMGRGDLLVLQAQFLQDYATQVTWGATSAIAPTGRVWHHRS